MAQQAKLTAQRRTQVGRNAIKKIKAAGMVPGVIYGSAQEPVNLQINGRELLNVLSHASGENILVELEILDGGEKQNALAMIQEIQHHPLQREILHVDFHAVSANETVSAEVPIETVGEAVGVKVHGGLLEHILRYLEVECLPADLPQVIEVDVTTLDVGQFVLNFISDGLTAQRIVKRETVKRALHRQPPVGGISKWKSGTKVRFRTTDG